MRRAIPFIVLMAAAVAAHGVDLGMLKDFQRGRYAANPIGRGGVAHAECLGSGEALLTAARPPGACAITPISTDARQTVVTWQCEGGASGRTLARRDSVGVYTVHVQGIEGGLPFAEHAEWRRLGDC